MAEANKVSRPSRAQLYAPRPDRDAVKQEAAERSIPVEQATLVGELDSVRVYGDWALGEVYSDGERIKITGAAIKDLVIGVSYTFRGEEKTHPKHGPGFDVSSAMPYIAPSRRSLERYLERNFSGVGKVKAAEFVERWIADGDNEEVAIESLRTKLLMEPWTLDLTGVAKKAEFKGNQSAAALEYVYRDFSTKLGGVPGMKDGVLRPLAEFCLDQGGDDAEEMGVSERISQAWTYLSQDPYAAIVGVSGYGFAMADLIGKNLNIDANALVRLRALVAHAVEEGCNRAGHVFLYEQQVHSAIDDLDPSVDGSLAIDAAIDSGMIVGVGEGGARKFYTPELLAAEKGIAKHIEGLCKRADPLVKTNRRDLLEEKIQAAAQAEWGFPLDDSQLAALVGIMTSPKRIHTLTAGPGHGKSALMELLTIMLNKKSMLFVGPTGKSAKVLNARVAKHGRSASTIHSAYGGAEPAEFKINRNSRLDKDVVVVDESSMADLVLARAVLDGLDDHAHVIFLGDKNQLPSVAPGAFLRDLLAIKAIDRHELSQPHRSAGGILDVVQQVGRGSVTCEDAQGVEFSDGLADAATDFGRVSRSYIEAVSQKGFENVVLLMSKRAGDINTPGWNTTYANARLREVCNPNAVKVPGASVYVGDRIIVRKNLTVEDANGEDAQIVNGDTGKILSWGKNDDSRFAGAKSVMLGLDDGRLIVLPSTEFNVLQHSYAMTVHSAQGSEYKHVVAVVTSGSPDFINQAMLFTGVSRAKEALQIYGKSADVQRVARTPLPWRNSDLVVRACRLLGEEVPSIYLNQKGSPARVAPVAAPNAAASAGGTRPKRLSERFKSMPDDEADPFSYDDDDGPASVSAAASASAGAAMPTRGAYERAALASAAVPVEAVPVTVEQEVPLLSISGRTRSWPDERVETVALRQRFR